MADMANGEGGPNIEQLLASVRAEEPGAWDRLLVVVHAELRAMAASKMKLERPGHSLAPTALVNEAVIRLFDTRRPSWQDRKQFFGAVAETMRRVLVDHARRRSAAKRGGGLRRGEYAELEPADVASDAEVIGVDGLIEKLAAINERAASVVKLRFFVGMPLEQVATALEIAERTAASDWAFARAWLLQQLKDDGGV